jgi:CheY-like chemotaxis protein
MKSLPIDILKGWRVVVIDDEPDGVEVVQILLEMYGAEVLTASNGPDGIALIIKNRPRFVICDISMPGMSGWEVIEALKLERSTGEIPVVALTAHAMTGDREKAMAHGFHNYLTKPIKPEIFVNSLLELLIYDIPELKHALYAS